MSKLDSFILAQEKRHAFMVSELQKSEQRIIDEITENFEPRVTSLEETRTYCRGVLKTVGDIGKAMTVAVPVVGSAAWFVFQWVNDLKNLKGGH